MANDYSGKLRNEIDILRKRNAELEASAEHTKRYGFEVKKNQDRLVEYNKKIDEIRKNEERINSLTADRIGLGKQINNLTKDFSGDLLKQLGVESSINLLKEARKTKDKEVLKQSKDYAKLLDGVAKGEIDVEEVTRQKVKFTGKYRDLVNQIQKTLIRTPNFSEKASIEKEAQDKIKAFQKSITDITAMLSSPKAMGVAIIGLVAKLATDFANQALDIRKELGTSAVDSARLAGNMSVASFQAKLLGGDTQQAASAVTSLTREFGSLDAVSSSVARQAGSITAQFGISGENLGKLVKQMSSLNGGSLETNINTLETVGNLARAARVAPADVLNDLAESTETFAKFSMQGGKNLARAAIEARKLGLNLQTVDKISESILDFETSIEKQMEASLLIGRQLNLDKARQLALEGDLEGVLAEVKNQVGGAEQLSKMNVIQRKALADAVGLEVSELSKLANQQERQAKAQEESVKSAVKLGIGVGAIAGLAAAIIPAIIGSVPGLQKLGLRQLGKGLAVVGAGAAMGGVAGGLIGKSMSAAPKAQTGGVVRETGMAVIHKGETISGTAGQFGTETNKLLRELISQNEILMGRLTNKVGDLALS